MYTKKDITVIIPVHKWDENIEKMFAEAVNSVDGESSIIVSTCADVPASDRYIIVKTDRGSSFQVLVNEGVKNVVTEWFTILEFDDEFSPIWFGNFLKYQEYNQQYNFFLPLNDLYTVQDNGPDKFVGNGNEVVWASSFSDVIGQIDEGCLKDYFDFYLPGGIFRKGSWDSIGGLKEKIKLTFWYEFMLRATAKGENFYVIPKIGYAHLLNRPDSLMDILGKEISQAESRFWFYVAKKERHFKEDRDIEIPADFTTVKTEEENEPTEDTDQGAGANQIISMLDKQ